MTKPPADDPLLLRLKAAMSAGERLVCHTDTISRPSRFGRGDEVVSKEVDRVNDLDAFEHWKVSTATLLNTLLPQDSLYRDSVTSFKNANARDIPRLRRRLAAITEEYEAGHLSLPAPLATGASSQLTPGSAPTPEAQTINFILNALHVVQFNIQVVNVQFTEAVERESAQVQDPGKREEFKSLALDLRAAITSGDRSRVRTALDRVREWSGQNPDQAIGVVGLLLTILQMILGS